MTNNIIKDRLDGINQRIEDGEDVEGLKKLKRHAKNLKRIYLENVSDGREEEDLDLFCDLCATIECIEEFLE